MIVDEVEVWSEVDCPKTAGAAIDLFSRRVVVWSMSAGMTAQLVTDALVMAIWRRGKPDALLHHSDRGSQYTSEQFQRHEEAYSLDGACTNWAEEFFSRMRRAEIGHHHHIAGAYLLRYAQESSWREDNRRQSNGEQMNRLAGLALKSKPSVDFSGYWQRHRMGGA